VIEIVLALQVSKMETNEISEDESFRYSNLIGEVFGKTHR